MTVKTEPMASQPFDVFISYNSKDQAAVASLVQRLKVRGVRVWIDSEQLVPGRPFQAALEVIVQTTSTAAIVVGPTGLGPWEVPEMRACLQEFVRRSLPVIPVLLPGAPQHPELPLFLREFTWVDLRGGLTRHGIDRLVWGISGMQVLETSRQLVLDRAAKSEKARASNQFVDAWGIASVKSRLHALSEIVAQAASDEANLAAMTFADDVLSVAVPVAFEMRWRRGYAAALERLLNIPKPQRRIGDMTIAEVEGCDVSDGVVTAVPSGASEVVVRLDGHPAVVIQKLTEGEQRMVVESVNLHGRLGVSANGERTVLARVGDIPLRYSVAVDDELSLLLFRNREALAPLIARLGMPGADWLLAHEENLSTPRSETDDIATRVSGTDGTVRSLESLSREVRVEVEEVVDATAVVTQGQSGETAQLRELLRTNVVRSLFGDLVDTDPQKVMELIKAFGKGRGTS